MEAIKRGNKVWVVRAADWTVESGVITSSYGDSDGINYRVRWGDGPWSGISTFRHTDVFKKAADARVALALRLRSRADELLSLAGQELAPSEDREPDGAAAT
jgi:hypothetical protein